MRLRRPDLLPAQKQRRFGNCCATMSMSGSSPFAVGRYRSSPPTLQR